MVKTGSIWTAGGSANPQEKRESSLLTTHWSESTLSSRWFGGPASSHESFELPFPGSLISAHQLGRLGSSSSQHGWTLEVVLQQGMRALSLVEPQRPPTAYPTPESKKGSPKVNLSSRQRFSKVEIVSRYAFEWFYPLQHSGVVHPLEREFLIDNLLVRIQMIWWTDLAPWEFGFPFPGSLTPTFLEAREKSYLSIL